MGILESQGKVSEFYYYDVLRINKKRIIQKKRSCLKMIDCDDRNSFKKYPRISGRY